ncbi:hypothetical protein LMG7974_01858 [Campylobacter majalis]|uniref:Glycine zipper domain-containing protein n=1 Tax=Campylobacter majalis TaxID=2790656 RepID=A0ABN7KCI1_9BACT|nr:glycine zipper domain-containing protein [Campylobacter majalis]CAD7289775.1 hypothetical protein LMG7974_01858 [Campylobacter majalis]
MKNKILSLSCVALLALSGCVSSNQDKLGGNVYNTGELNQQQNVKVVTIKQILGAKVTVDNTNANSSNKVVGGLLGAATGAVVGYALGGGSSKSGAVVGGVVGGTLGTVAGDKISEQTEVIDGVSIVYELEGNIYTSTQAGKLCEFSAGSAYLISMGANETRIQPNANCK